MARMYTLDGKLLTGTPEIRIGDKVYPVDDRAKTVKKAMKLFNDSKSGKDNFDNMDELFRLAFGEKNAKEIDDMELSFGAMSTLMELTVSAMIGEERVPDKSSGSEKGDAGTA